MSAVSLSGARILVTGPTGQVAKPLSLALAKDATVFGLARFNNKAAKAELEAGGVQCITGDLVAGAFDEVPTDIDYVLNLAIAKTRSWDKDLAANVEGLGLLMSRLHNAKGLLHCSSTAVYQPNGHHKFVETDPLGDNHRVPSMEAFMPTYSINKIAAEAMARYVAREHGIPTIIARLNVPYGNNGGWPWMHLEQVLAGQPIAVHTDAPSVYNPIHEDDIIASIPKLLEHASVPETIVNWGGSEQVSIEEWSTYFGELVGKTAQFVNTDQVLESVTIDTSKQTQLVGPTTVHWKDGMRRLAETFHPELFAGK
jgi:nucleoside-diphosphate-sugar epimerase